MKKATCLRMIAIALVCAACLVGAASAGTYSGGDGSAGNPYQIATVADLYELGNNQGDWGANFIQTDNIAISDISDVTYDNNAKTITLTNGTSTLTYNWGSKAFTGDYTPVLYEGAWKTIGKATADTGAGTLFTGTYDGQGHEISGLYIDHRLTAGKWQGMFGGVKGATIQNLNVTNSAVIDTHSTSGRDGILVGLVADKAISTNISNVQISKSAVISNIAAVGGLVGYVYGASLETNGCTINNIAIYSTTNNAGVLIGCTGGLSSIEMNKCMAKDSMVAVASYSAGGMVGGVNGGDIELNECTVVNCVIEGTYYLGSLVGNAGGSSLVMDGCNVNGGSITGTYAVGGAIGNGMFAIVNGLVPKVANTTISGVTISTTPTNSGTVAGLIGYYNSASLPISGTNITGNTIENVIINTDNGAYTYLFDGSCSSSVLGFYPIGGVSNGIARLAEIELSNDNIIRNSTIIKTGLAESTVVTGFANLGNDMLKSVVIGDEATEIAANAFKNKQFDSANLGFYVGENITTIGADAFSGSNLEVLYSYIVYNPGTGFAGASVIVGPGLLKDSTGYMKSGTFAPLADNKFETAVKNDVVEATYVVDDFAETPATSWVAGTAYRAVYAKAVLEFIMEPEVGDNAFVKSDDDYYLALGTSANISVYLNVTTVDPTPVNFTTYNMTYAANFTMDEMTAVYADAKNFMKVYEIKSTAAKTNDTVKLGIQSGRLDYYTMNDGDKLFIGNITVTAPSSWSDVDNLDVYTITLKDALKVNREGVIPQPESAEENDDFIDIAGTSFNFYPVKGELAYAAYHDGRYEYKQKLQASEEMKPTFYLYQDVFRDSYADGAYFQLYLDDPDAQGKGYNWSNGGLSQLTFKHVQTIGGDNLTNHVTLNGLVSSAHQIKFAILQGSDPYTEVLGSSRNASVVIEDYMQSNENNSMTKSASEDGWFFNTPYTVTMEVRPGPIAYNWTNETQGHAAGVMWDSSYQIPNLTNNAGKEAVVEWRVEFANNENTTFNNYTAGTGKLRGQEVMNSADNLMVKESQSAVGENVTITLTGWKLGDANKNGEVSLNDASSISFYAIAGASALGAYDAALTGVPGSTYEHLIISDCNKQGGDGAIDVADILMFNKWLTEGDAIIGEWIGA